MAEQRELTEWEKGVREMVRNAMHRFRGNQTHASQWLGISHPTLRRYAKLFGFLPWDPAKVAPQK
jgi:DNA-binding protein Fis